MITPRMRLDAKLELIEQWGDHGAHVIAACDNQKPFNGTFTEFMNECTACGGNWGGMLLSGIKRLFPEVYDAIPDNIGKNAFFTIGDALILCGVDTTS